MSLSYISTNIPTSRALVTAALVCGFLACTACDDETDFGSDTTSVSQTSVEPPLTTTTATTTTTETSTVTDFDPFANAQQAWHFDVDEEQRKRMDEIQENGEDQYPPPGGGTHADGLVVTLASGETLSYGKMSLRSIGQSSWRDWAHIPNLRIDSDKFQKGLRFGGYEHLRLNNGQVGGIMREHIALRTWESLGYLAPRTQFTRVSSNIWGEDVFVPYTLVEVYKRGFCNRSIPGGCVNLWEGQGEPQDLFGACQVDACEETRLREFADAMNRATPGDGYMQSLADFVDWPKFQQFMCLSWMTATGDDYVHNLNNTVLAERTDGKFMFLPYSTDISAGQSWYPEVPLLGSAALARGCAFDNACWQGLISTCSGLLDAWEILGAAKIVEDTYVTLQANNLLRKGDDARYEQLRDWYGMRAAELRSSEFLHSVACQDDTNCVDAPEGATRCNLNVNLCKVPCSSEAECPKEQHCSLDTQTCEPGEAADDLGDRFNPTWMQLPVFVNIPIDVGDEDCVSVYWEAGQPPPRVSTYSPDCSDSSRSDTIISLYDVNLELIAQNDNVADDNWCSAVEAPPGVLGMIACVSAADSSQALGEITLVIEGDIIVDYALPNTVARAER